jgi:transposase
MVPRLMEELSLTKQELSTVAPALDAARRDLARVKREYEQLHAAYTRKLEELALLKRRMFIAKAERPVAAAEQLVLDALFDRAKVDAKAQLDLAHAEDQATSEPSDDTSPDAPKANPDAAGGESGGADSEPKKPARRNLDQSTLPVKRFEIHDPELQAEGTFFRFEISRQLGWERGGPVIIETALAIYRMPDEELPSATKLVTSAKPREVFRRGLLAPSFAARLLASKYVLGVPFYRLEDELGALGAPLDRGTMCRYAEEAGAVLGGIVVAMRDDSLANACCLSTDATGVAVQPERLPDDKTRKPCRKAHFFVVLADRDHVFFEYQPKHTSAAVCDMFRGFTGYIQADAHTVYDALFAGRTPKNGAPPTGPPPTEVGCWAHARRKFWEAAVCKHADGVEGLRLIAQIYDIDRGLAKLSPAQRKRARDVAVRPLVDAFFVWAERALVKRPPRGLVNTALGYAVRHKIALQRFLEDGKLRLDNNHSERAARKIATGRKAWLFVGSDDHGSATGNLLSLVASCRLHGLDPEAYFAEVLRLIAVWPADRLLELSPRDWAATRARLDPKTFVDQVGYVVAPDALPAKEQASA